MFALSTCFLAVTDIIINKTLLTIMNHSKLHTAWAWQLFTFLEKNSKQYKPESVCRENCQEHRVFWGRTACRRDIVSEHRGLCLVAETRSASEESCDHQPAKPKVCCSVQMSQCIESALLYLPAYHILQAISITSTLVHSNLLVATGASHYTINGDLY